MLRIINVTVEDKVARNDRPREAVYVCGNSDFVVRFAFDAEWAAFDTKTARFRYNGTHKDIVFTGNECPMPVIENAHNIQVGVFAGNLHTTTPAELIARKSILCGAGSPAAPRDDVYAQIMEQLNRIDSPVKTVNGIAPDENGNVQVEIPEGVTSWNDLPDKPFEPVDVVHLEETSVVTSENNVIKATVPIVMGETYTVVVDGVRYTCVGNDHSGMGSVDLGFTDSEPSGIPVRFCCWDNGDISVIADDEYTVYTVSILKENGAELIKERSIPKVIARKDDISWNNLSGKPVAIEPFVTEVINETEVETVPIWYDQNLHEGHLQDCVFGIEIGATYIVTFDGVEYECTGMSSPDMPYLGDENLDDDGEPFWLQAVYEEHAYASDGFPLLITKTSGNHTISVKKVVVGREVLDEQYIPSTIARVEDIPKVPVTSVNGQTGDVVIDIPAPVEPNIETWTFELENGTTVTKQVMLA